jgi:hypothetical protein
LVVRVAGGRTAVVVPGGSGGPATPLLGYAAEAAERRGARPYPVWWNRPGEAMAMAASPADRGPWVCGEVEPVLAGAGRRPLLIGRSLGSNAAALAADRRLPAVWLNPMLTTGWVSAALERAEAPFLLVGGAADTEWWDGALARTLTPYVLEVPGADHRMMVPGPLSASAEILGLVATAVEEFLDAVVWR